MTRLADLCDELNSKESMNKLREETINACRGLKPFDCSCKFCQKKYDVKGNWHPENINKMDDVWKLSSIIKGFGYPSYEYDSVTWTCRVGVYRKLENVEAIGCGVNIAQALCHLTIDLSKLYKTT